LRRKAYGRATGRKKGVALMGRESGASSWETYRKQDIRSYPTVQGKKSDCASSRGDFCVSKVLRERDPSHLKATQYLGGKNH